ncbi:MAG: bifunctional folylpolyglutamate synthase/dihydrofolate synthase [Sulfurimonas sp.]|nr:bifunctional folylpolyglutamate synthase/dihydrofolate synthase [Sulfurimonas sp.]
MILDKFLQNKPLFYETIDYERFPKIFKKIRHHFKIPKIIHIIGTNGKGTTGRFLATALFNNNYKVGHYTSPHIMKFNERIWLNSSDVSDEILQRAHNKLKKIIDDVDLDALSYFEYTTLLAMWVFSSCDYVVLEAGLGGEFDATAVFDKVLTLVTPIDLDHQAFLGDTIKEIATTKLNAIQNNAILASQKYSQVYDTANKISKKLNIKKIEEILNFNDLENLEKISKKLNLAKYLKNNLALAICGLKFLNIEYKCSDFNNSRLFGRLSCIGENILVDVGHNPLAATSIVNQLMPNKYILIYNSYKDKDYKQILTILKSIIQSVEIIDINGQRVESINKLQKVLNDLKIEYTKFKEVKSDKQYLVFGSFSVVEQFLKEHNE